VEGVKLGTDIDEGGAASKSPYYKFGYFLSMSQEAVSADLIPISAVGIFSSKTAGTKT
jgi:CRISPR-associated Cas5-like protein